MKKVVIVGGGITGLTAAYHLQEKAKETGVPLDYILVEQAHSLGGKILTEKEKGFVVEGGPDCFIQDKPAVIQLAARLGISDKLMPSNDASTGTFVLSNGKLHKLPDGMLLLVPTKIIPFALSPLISWPGKIRMGLDLLLPRKKADGDESLASFVTRRLGKEALDKIGEPLIGGIHGSNSQNMSLRASFPRFLNMEREHGSLIVGMLKARAKAPKPAPPKPGAPKRTFFMSFVGGMSDLVQGITAKLDSDKIILGTKVTRVEKNGDKYTVHLDNTACLEADAVILATPGWDSAAVLKELDPTITSQLEDIPQASSATVNMVFRREDIPGDLGAFGFVIPASEKRQLNALTYTSVKWNHRVPDPEKYVAIRTFVGGGRNQELAFLTDEELIRLSCQEIGEILEIKGKPIFAKVHHWIKARPQYVLGHLDRVKDIETRLSKYYPGLWLAGASYRGIGVPDCVSDGIKAAENVLGHLSQSQSEAAR